MNLVQINERLKEMPLQAVQQYANGMNPEVPPYLALGELQRRQSLQKQMAAGQGAATGQPSIKEQMEQKAGLMALQGAQMQQQQQQMMQPRPGPVPAGAPQPEPQPEAEAMMGGGLARIPVRDDMYQFAEGGIIAFYDGGTARARKEGESFEDYRKRMFELELQTQREKNEAEKVAREAERQRRVAERGEEFMVPPSPFLQRPPLPSSPEEMQAMPDKTQQTAQRVGAMKAPAFADPRRLDTPTGQGLAALARLQSTTPTPTAAPGAMRTAQPAAPRMEQPAPAAAPITQPAGMEFVERARQDLTPQTTEQLLAERRKLMGELAPGQYGEEAIKRAEERRRQYEAGKPSGLDELIRVFGQAGQYKGLSGLAPAYTQMQAQKRAQDLKYAEEEEKTRALIDAARRAEGLAGVEGITKGAETSRTRAAQTAATLGAQQMQGATQEKIAGLDRESRIELAKIDRQFQERMKKIPQAQMPSLQERMLDEYTRVLGSRTKAYEYMQTMLQENKAELSQPQLIRQYAKDWGSMDVMARQNYEKQGIDTVEKYINYMTGLTTGTGGGKSVKTPALPSGFKLD